MTIKRYTDYIQNICIYVENWNCGKKSFGTKSINEIIRPKYLWITLDNLALINLWWANINIQIDWRHPSHWEPFNATRNKIQCLIWVSNEVSMKSFILKLRQPLENLTFYIGRKWNRKKEPASKRDIKWNWKATLKLLSKISENIF